MAGCGSTIRWTRCMLMVTTTRPQCSRMPQPLWWRASTTIISTCRRKLSIMLMSGCADWVHFISTTSCPRSVPSLRPMPRVSVAPLLVTWNPSMTICLPIMVIRWQENWICSPSILSRSRRLTSWIASQRWATSLPKSVLSCLTNLWMWYCPMASTTVLYPMPRPSLVSVRLPVRRCWMWPMPC